MKTRLLGAAVLFALLVLFVPMFFSSTPPRPGADQSVSLAIPPAPDRELQTRTMSLNPDSAGASSAADTLSTQVVTPQSGDAVTTVNIGSGASPAQPVIPQRSADPQPVAPTKPAAPAKSSAASDSHEPSAPEAAATQPAAGSAADAAKADAPHVGHGSYTINLSAYASDSGAARLQKRVRAQGYPVTGHAVTQAGKQLTLVTAGPFETRAAAEAARLKIIAANPGVPARVEQDASQASTAPAKPAAPRGSTNQVGGWAVQLVAVSSKSDAQALSDKLRANGFDGFVDSVRSGGQTLWRVRAGPQTQRADAQRIHDQIKAKLGIDGNVVSIP